LFEKANYFENENPEGMTDFATISSGGMKASPKRERRAACNASEAERSQSPWKKEKAE